jgi:hypothetical protein
LAGGGAVAVVVGGRSTLEEASRRAGALYAAALGRLGVPAELVPYDARTLERLRSGRFSAVYDATNGADGAVTDLARWLSIETLNARPGTAAIYDKRRLKAALARRGLPVPAHLMLDAYLLETSWRAILAIDEPIVVKPAKADVLSDGVRTFEPPLGPKADEIRRHLASLRAIDDTILIERQLRGTELCIGFLALPGGTIEAFPPMTPRVEGGLFDHRAKVSGRFQFEPVRGADTLLDRARPIAAALVDAFEIRGLFYINAFDCGAELVTFDAGTNVGLGERSYLTRAAAVLGRDVGTLVELHLRACLAEEWHAPAESAAAPLAAGSEVHGLLMSTAAPRLSQPRVP